MSAFDDIANDVPTLVRDPSSLALSLALDDEPGNSWRFPTALKRVEQLVLIAKDEQPSEFVKHLREVCLDGACRDTVLQLGGEEAQVVVDAIQLTLDELRLTDEFYRHALYLLVKLSANTNILPTSLFVQGVDIGPVRDPCHGGAFADIYHGHYDGFEVAVKKLRFFGNQKAHIQRAFCNEALVWRQLAHVNILPFVGVDAETFADTGFLCMISPWMAKGSLLDYKRSEGYDPDKDTIRILQEVSCGLAYLHGQKVVHGDIHVANIFIDAEGHARLADFGLSVVGETTLGRMSSGSNSAGNPRYLAPERITATQNMRRTTACDVYAFACVCLFLYTGKHPFHEYTKEIIVSLKVMKGERPARPSPEHCRPDMTDNIWQLIEDAWHQDPSYRPTILQLEERIRPADVMSISSRQSSSTMSGHRLAHRELVKLSMAEAKPPDDASSIPPRTRSTPSFNSLHVNVHGLHDETPTVERLPYEPSMLSFELSPETSPETSPRPTLNKRLFSDINPSNQSHEPPLRTALNELEHQHRKHPMSIHTPPSVHDRGKYKDILELLEGKNGSVADVLPALNESNVEKRQHGASSTSDWNSYLAQMKTLLSRSEQGAEYYSSRSGSYPTSHLEFSSPPIISFEQAACADGMHQAPPSKASLSTYTICLEVNATGERAEKQRGPPFKFRTGPEVDDGGHDEWLMKREDREMGRQGAERPSRWWQGLMKLPGFDIIKPKDHEKMSLDNIEPRVREEAGLDVVYHKNHEKEGNQINLLVLGSSKSTRTRFMASLLDMPGSRFRRHTEVNTSLDVPSIAIQRSVLECLRVALDLLNMKSNSKRHVKVENEDYRKTILAFSDQIDQDLSIREDVARALTALSKDLVLTSAISRLNSDKLDVHSRYFVREMKRIISAGYQPTEDDVRHFRAIYEGVAEVTFPHANVVYRAVTVQEWTSVASWRNHLENITAIVFLASLADYDEDDPEDPSFSKIQASMMDLDSICNSRRFQRTPIILLLTDVDALTIKLQKKPLQDFFPSFNSGDVTAGRSYVYNACDYLLCRFVSINETARFTRIHAAHITPLDDRAVKFTLSMVQDHSQKSLQRLGPDPGSC